MDIEKTVWVLNKLYGDNEISPTDNRNTISIYTFCCTSTCAILYLILKLITLSVAP